MTEHIIVALIVAVAAAIVARRLFRSAAGRGGCHCASRKSCPAKGICNTEHPEPTGRDDE